MMKETGFVNTRIVGTTGYRTSAYTMGTLFYAERSSTVR